MTPATARRGSAKAEPAADGRKHRRADEDEQRDEHHRDGDGDQRLGACRAKAGLGQAVLVNGPGHPSIRLALAHSDVGIRRGIRDDIEEGYPELGGYLAVELDGGRMGLVHQSLPAPTVDDRLQ